MKALTIWQPWAGMVAAGVKGNETRSWPTSYRGRIAIHAAKLDIRVAWRRYVNDTVTEVICRRLGLPGIFDAVETFPTGCILATAELMDCIRITPEYVAKLDYDELQLGDYTPGRFAWKLEDVKAFPEPIPVRGRQGLWNWES